MPVKSFFQVKTEFAQALLFFPNMVSPVSDSRTKALLKFSSVFARVNTEDIVWFNNSNCDLKAITFAFISGDTRTLPDKISPPATRTPVSADFFLNSAPLNCFRNFSQAAGFIIRDSEILVVCILSISSCNDFLIISLKLDLSNAYDIKAATCLGAASRA